MNSTLVNGLAILEALAWSPDGCGISDIAKELDLPKSHAHRLLRSLVEAGYARQGDDRRYYVTWRMLRTSAALLESSPIRRAAQPLLYRLSAKIADDAVVAVVDGDQAVVIAAASRGGQRGDPGAEIAQPSLWHASACGKCLLAHLRDGPRHALIADLELTREGPRTITDRTALRAECERIVARGWASNDREIDAQRFSLAAPIRSDDGNVIAALGLSLTVTRAREVGRPVLRAALLSARGELEADLAGGQPPC